MSMLSTQIDNLRLMARLVLDYEPAEIRRALREAADTIESLRDRLQNLAFERGMRDAMENATMGRGECEFEINIDMTAIRCSACGYELPKGTSLRSTRFCGGCGKAVKR